MYIIILIMNLISVFHNLPVYPSEVTGNSITFYTDYDNNGVFEHFSAQVQPDADIDNLYISDIYNIHFIGLVADTAH